MSAPCVAQKLNTANNFARDANFSPACAHAPRRTLDENPAPVASKRRWHSERGGKVHASQHGDAGPLPAQQEADMSRLVLCMAGGLLVLCIAVRGQTVFHWPTYPIKQTPTELQPAMRRGELVILAIQSATSRELTTELASGGPGDAIRVCHLSATSLIYRLGREEGIVAGRTAARLRLPINAPRPWAAPIVGQYANAKTASVDGFVVDLGDKVGVMRPVVHRAECSPCHGVQEKLDPRVRAELRDRYPADRATGFKDGELRGWIWVEVPKNR